ncbi:MAG: LLM class flavin-dependent oxidoreductase [Microbacterium sp.]
MTSSLVSIGVAGNLGPELVGRLAPVVEHAGFHALWVNDTPDGDALEALAAAAATTSTLVLATGVLPVDRRPADAIARETRTLGLPEDRLVLGIGAGGLRVGALSAVGSAADELRERLTARVLVGALGPRMRRLAATRADGALLSWLTPDEAAEQRDALHAFAPDTHVALYARTALDPAAVPARDAEAARYAGYAAYAAHFDRLRIDPLDTVVPRGDEAAADDIRAFAASVDELVLRAITPAHGLADYTAFVEAAAQLLAD